MESCARGYHIHCIHMYMCQELWEAVIGKEFQCQRERDNPTDINAVTVRKGPTVVDYLP